MKIQDFFIFSPCSIYFFPDMTDNNSDMASEIYPNKNRTYVAIDLKSFYASVECAERGLDPLTTNLVVADESRTAKTICLAVSPSLKAYGLSGRSRLFEVEQKAREILEYTGKPLEYIVAKPRMALYIDYSSRIYETYLDFVSHEDISVYSIDEVFIDVTDYLKLYNMSAHDLAARMVRAVLNKTGITATVGVASNLYLCKIAMDIEAKHMPADKDGVRIAVLDEKKFREKYWDYRPLTDFWRTGKGTAKRLEKNGMFTWGDVARMSIENEKLLYRIFGIDAEILIDHAWGYEPCTIKDIKAYKPRTNSLSQGQVLSCPYEYDKARIIVKEMAEALVQDMIAKNLVSKSFTLMLFFDRITVDNGDYDGEIVMDYYGRLVPAPVGGSVSLATATASAKIIREAIVGIFDEIADPALFVRRVNVCANEVTTEDYVQLDLFTDIDAVEKEKKVQKAMLTIQEKYGRNAVLKGTNLEEGATAKDRNRQIGGHRA